MMEEGVQRFAGAGAGWGVVGRKKQVRVCANGQLVDVEGEGACHRVVEGPGRQAQPVHRVAHPPGARRTVVISNSQAVATATAMIRKGSWPKVTPRTDAKK